MYSLLALIVLLSPFFLSFSSLYDNNIAIRCKRHAFYRIDYLSKVDFELNALVYRKASPGLSPWSITLGNQVSFAFHANVCRIKRLPLELGVFCV